MKNLIVICLFMAFASCSGNSQAKLKRYDVKSGMVKYEIAISGKVLGSTISGEGTESLYFKDWGAIELLEEKSNQTTETNIFGIKNSETTNSHTMSKLDDGESYHVDFDKKQIFLRRDLAMDMTKTYREDGDAGEVGKNMLESVGGKVIGTEKFLGYDCELWDVMGAKQWMHKGVVLKIEMTVLGITTIKEAKTAEFNKNIADKYFQLPDFPIQKEEGFLDNEEYQEEEEDMDEKISILSNMSYEEWKKMALADKQNAKYQNMSDAELRKTYDLVQKMLKMRSGK